MGKIGKEKPHWRRIIAVGVVVWVLSGFLGISGLLLLHLPLLEVGAVAVLQRRRFMRAATQFPAPIG